MEGTGLIKLPNDGRCAECGADLTPDELELLTGQICKACAIEPDYEYKVTSRKLTRNERLQMAADAGYDTWDDYNGDK